MKIDITEHFATLIDILGKIATTSDDGSIYPFEESIENSVNLICEQAKYGGKLLFIGNGASASISSHMATDFWKNGGIKALAFNDGSLLTCISNDYGYNHVFEKPINMFAEKNDVLIAISASGQSENILNAVSAARQKGLKIITLSGFNEENPLRKLGDINFYVPVTHYGYVEVIHHVILHSLVDVISKAANG
jgi:D-sedoheptulose 7-phosphate isomerase